ncbi:hypothetical protein J0H58_27690 [bacterium]|nr:hypothetical protein [bacterium]
MTAIALAALCSPTFEEVTTFADGTELVRPVTWETQPAGAFVRCRDIFGRAATWYTVDEPDGDTVRVCPGQPAWASERDAQGYLLLRRPLGLD